jgi:hypothetical protein
MVACEGPYFVIFLSAYTLLNKCPSGFIADFTAALFKTTQTPHIAQHHIISNSYTIQPNNLCIISKRTR